MIPKAAPTQNAHVEAGLGALLRSRAQPAVVQVCLVRCRSALGHAASSDCRDESDAERTPAAAWSRANGERDPLSAAAMPRCMKNERVAWPNVHCPAKCGPARRKSGAAPEARWLCYRAQGLTPHKEAIDTPKGSTTRRPLLALCPPLVQHDAFYLLRGHVLSILAACKCFAQLPAAAAVRPSPSPSQVASEGPKTSYTTVSGSPPA